jgi:hypothetical protein
MRSKRVRFCSALRNKRRNFLLNIFNSQFLRQIFLPTKWDLNLNLILIAITEQPNVGYYPVSEIRIINQFYFYFYFYYNNWTILIS